MVDKRDGFTSMLNSVLWTDKNLEAELNRWESSIKTAKKVKVKQSNKKANQMKKVIESVTAEMKSIIAKIKSGTDTEANRLQLAILTKFIDDLNNAQRVWGDILPVS